MTSLHSVAHQCAVSGASHYPSLELCRKLKEVGFPEGERYYDSGGEYGECFTVYPSVMEMLDFMPYKADGITTMEKYTDRGNTTFYVTPPVGEVANSFSGTLPNALAEMILWLHENNYISFSK